MGPGSRWVHSEPPGGSVSGALKKNASMDLA